MQKVEVFLNRDTCREEKIYYTTTWYKDMLQAIDDAEKWCKENGMEVDSGD